MSTLINIRGDTDDPFYRYKMPRIKAKVEGRGNGIKTVIPNLKEISRALVRPTIYLVKYFGNELGAQTICDEKLGRYILTGNHSVETMQACTYGFINKYVLCGSCSNPETELSVTKDQMINRTCKACGKITIADMRHKFAQFIIKNPPETYQVLTKNTADASGGAKMEKEIISFDDAPESGEFEGEVDISNLNADFEEFDFDEDDYQFDADSTEDAAPLDSAGSAAKDDKIDDADDPVEEFAAFVEGASLDTLTPQQLVDRVSLIGLPRSKAIAVFAQIVLNDGVLEQKQIEHFRPFFSMLLQTQKDQLSFLGAIERLVGVTYEAALLKKTHALLAAVYQSQLLSEETFLLWNKKGSKKYVDAETAKKVRQYAAPFIQWLTTADDSDDE